MPDTTLAGTKAAYVHLTGTVAAPAWLGRAARIKDTLDAQYSKLDVDYAIDQWPGDLQATNVVWRSPNPSTLSLVAKETISTHLYAWHDAWDLDIRLQCAGQVDNPLNWVMIKRFIQCWPDQLRTEDETSLTKDDGETSITIPISTAYKPVMIKSVLPTVVSDVAFASDDRRICAVKRSPEPAYYGETSSTDTIAVDAYEYMVVLVDPSGNVWYSHDNGATFIASTGAANCASIWIINYSTVLAGGNGQLFVSTDGGITFADVDLHNILTNAVIAVRDDGHGTCYLLESNGMVSAYQFGDITQIFDVSTYGLSVTDLWYDSGLLYVAGFNAIGPCILSSADGLSWMLVLQLQGDATPWGDVMPTVKLASAGYGVLYAVIVSNVAGTIHVYFYRSVNWGYAATWVALYHHFAAGGSAEDLYVPNSIACATVNHVESLGTVFTM